MNLASDPLVGTRPTRASRSWRAISRSPSRPPQSQDRRLCRQKRQSRRRSHKKLADTPPDLVILDWMLPGVSGPEICIRLRAEEATRMLPIIMLSARGEESLRLRGFSAGADDFVVKPFPMRELMARVRALLRRSRFALADHLLTRGDLQLDRDTRRVRRVARMSVVSRKEFGCLNVCLSGLGAFFRASTCWSAFGGHPSTSPTEQLMSTYGAFAKSCQLVTNVIRFLPCPEPAIPSMKLMANLQYRQVRNRRGRPDMTIGNGAQLRVAWVGTPPAS